MPSLEPDACALKGFLVPCAGPATHEHILNKGKARGNKAVREYLNESMNIALTCHRHNVGKLADTRDARRIMLLQKIWAHGWSAVRDYYAAAPWKVSGQEFSLESMLEE